MLRESDTVLGPDFSHRVLPIVLVHQSPRENANDLKGNFLLIRVPRELLLTSRQQRLVRFAHNTQRLLHALDLNENFFMGALGG